MTIDGQTVPHERFEEVNEPSNPPAASGLLFRPIGLIQDSTRRRTHAAATLAPQPNRLVRDAAVRGAQIICLKELFNAPYFCKSQQVERFDLAETIPGPTTDAMIRLARELAVVLVVPIFERQAPGVYRNSAVIIDADGSVLGVYRKMHIPDDPLFNEKYYFTPGDVPGFRVFKTRYATIGVLICWDQWYPEAARITSPDGRVQYALLPDGDRLALRRSAQEWGDAQVDAWRTMQRSHAIANGVWLPTAPNRIGHEDEPGTDGSISSTAPLIVRSVRALRRRCRRRPRRFSSPSAIPR